MQARQEVLRDVLVPELVDLVLAAALARPLLDERAMDDVDRLDEERARSRGRVEDLSRSGRPRSTPSGISSSDALGHLAPGRRVGEAVLEAELGLEQLVDRADDVRDDRSRRVEDAALHPLLASYSLRKSS